MLHVIKAGEYIRIEDSQGDECDLLGIDDAENFLLQLIEAMQHIKPSIKKTDDAVALIKKMISLRYAGDTADVLCERIDEAYDLWKQE
jgi:hypothetical protein